CSVLCLFFFFFQAEDGIRDRNVTGVQTCALPIFASEPFFPHGITGIFISQGAKIGKDAVIFQQVTIGSNTLKGSKSYGAPVIGDNCYIGAGAKIIGGIKIGDNVRIGANAVVVKDVPDNAVVVNQPGRVII